MVTVTSANGFVFSGPPLLWPCRECLTMPGHSQGVCRKSFTQCLGTRQTEPAGAAPLYPGQMSEGSFINTPATGPNQGLDIPTPGSGSDQSREPDGQATWQASLCSVHRRRQLDGGGLLRMVPGSHTRNKASNHHVHKMPARLIHGLRGHLTPGVGTEPLSPMQERLVTIFPPPK